MEYKVLNGIPREVPFSEQQQQTSSGWENLCKNRESISQLAPNTTLTIGFGVSNQLTPRILSYPLLGLEMLRDNPQMKLEMYVATQFAQLQGVTMDQAHCFDLQLRQTLLRFVKEFYGDIQDRVSFVETQPLNEERIQVIKELAKLLETNPEITKFVQRKAQTESDIKNAFAYIAAHSLYMRDPLPIDKELFLVAPTSDNSPVTMIGGPAEEIMWNARQDILTQMDCRVPSQLFTTIGRMPPYYRRQSEPLYSDSQLIETIPQAMLADGDVFRDYACLLIALARAQGRSDKFSELRAKEKDRQEFLAQDFTFDSLNTLQLFINRYAQVT